MSSAWPRTKQLLCWCCPLASDRAGKAVGEARTPPREEHSCRDALLPGAWLASQHLSSDQKPSSARLQRCSEARRDNPGTPRQARSPAWCSGGKNKPRVRSTGLGQRSPECWVLLPRLLPGSAGCSRLSLPAGRRNAEPQGCSPKGQQGRLPKRKGDGAEAAPSPPDTARADPQGETPGTPLLLPVRTTSTLQTPGSDSRWISALLRLGGEGWLDAGRAPRCCERIPLFGVQLLNQPPRCGAAPAHPS